MNMLATIVAAPALPDASAWHQTDIAQAIVADIKTLAKLSERMADRYRSLSIAPESVIGEIHARCQFGKPTRYVASGLIDNLYGELETLRDDAIDIARLAAYPASFSGHAAEFDEYSDAVGEHLDTVAKVLEGAGL